MSKDYENRILIIDGTYLAYKSYFATLYSGNGLMHTTSGVVTNEIVGFFNILIGLINFYSPSHIFVAFDGPVKTFRHESFDEYKANRKKAPREFYMQLDVIKNLLTALNIKNEIVNGFEADDIIAKVTNMFQSQKKILIYSADQDLNQLIDQNVAIIKKVKKDNLILDLNNFQYWYDFKPSQVVDYKAIVGDSSDNFKGIPGIGPKTACDLLAKYGTLETLYQNLDKIPTKYKTKFIEYKQTAEKYKFLATLCTDFDLQTQKLDDINITNLDLTKQAVEILDKYELKTTKNKLQNLMVN